MSAMSAGVPGGCAQGWHVALLACACPLRVGTDIADKARVLKKPNETAVPATRRGEALPAAARGDALRAARRKTSRSRCDPALAHAVGVENLGDFAPVRRRATPRTNKGLRNRQNGAPRPTNLEGIQMGRTTELTRPQAMRNAPQAPSDLPAEGRTLWQQTIGARPASEWNACDAALLALYVGAVLDVRRLDREIAKTGEVVDGRISPLVRIRAAREALLLAVAKKLRLTPCSRYTAKDVGRLDRHARKASAAAAVLDEDDLLARLQ